MPPKQRSWTTVTTLNSFKGRKKIRVFGVARVSTDKQAQKIGESLDHQTEVLTNWVKAKHSLNAPQEWCLVEIFVENEDSEGKRRGRSATSRNNRQGLAKALELARAGLVDVVVVTKLDRIARNVKDYIDISAEFNSVQVALVCLDLDIDTSTPDGQMIMRNHANLAQWQAERIAQYSYETARRHVQQGRPLGPPPLGYHVTKDGNGKTTYIIDDGFREHVEIIEKLYLSNRSVDRVVTELHKAGYRTRKGKTYSKPQVLRILQNIRYTARQDYEGKIYQGNWPPLRSIETHERIKRILQQNAKRKHGPAKSQNNSYVYVLQGILKCGACKSSMIPRPGTSKNGTMHPYYVCDKAEKTKGIDCDLIYLPARGIDEVLIEFIRRLKLKHEVIEKVIGEANKASSSQLKLLCADLERIQNELKVIRQRSSKLVEILADSDSSRIAAIKIKLLALQEEEDVLVKEENRLQNEIGAERRQAGTAKEQIQALTLFNDLFLSNRTHPLRIKTIISRFVDFVVCHVTDKKRIIGRLDVGLFGRPLVEGDNKEVWQEALRNLAEEYKKTTEVSQEEYLRVTNDTRKFFVPQVFAREEQMGWATGIEPATPRSTILCSNQLSYAHHEGKMRHYTEKRVVRKALRR